MATKKPLVVGPDGRPQQIQAGDVLSPADLGDGLALSVLGVTGGVDAPRADIIPPAGDTADQILMVTKGNALLEFIDPALADDPNGFLLLDAGSAPSLKSFIPITRGGTGQATAVAGKDALTVQGADIASAGTTNLANATGEYVHITGTTTITALGTAAAGLERVVKFSGILTLTHNATSLILPGNTNITTAANDRAIFRSLGSGNWVCVVYVRAAAPPVSGTNTGDQTTVSGNAGTATALQNARTIGGVSFNGTANIVPQTIESANEAADATCFLLFITASGTQSLQPKNNTGLTYNSATNVLAATTFSGGLAGNANTASTLVSARLINGVSFNGSANILAPDYSNVIDNGNFAVWQRGASFAAIASGAFCADRFAYVKAGAVVHTVTRDTTVPTVAQSGSLSLYSLKMEVTTADASIAAGDTCYLQQAVEGSDFQVIAQRTFTLSFWVRASTTGTYCVAFRNSVADRCYVATYTIAIANTWEYKTITVSASPTAGTWDYTNGAGLVIAWAQSCGSTFQTTAGAWQTGNFIATSGQVNNTATIGNTFYLSQVMLVPGSTAYPIQPLSYADDLAKCQRYFLVLTLHPLGFAINGDNMYSGGAFTFPVTMRAAPTLATVPTAAFAASAGANGTVNFADATLTGARVTNSALNWTANALIKLTAGITAEI